MKVMRRIFSPVNIIAILALIVILAVVIVGIVNSNGTAMATSDKYMSGENLAEGAKITAKASGKSSIVDGKVSTVGSMRIKQNTDIIIDLGAEKTFNSIIIKEDGLNVKSFEVLVSVVDGNKLNYKRITASDKIEYHRLLTFDSVTSRHIKIIIIEADRAASFKEIEVYNEQKRDASKFRVTGYYADNWMSSIMFNDNLTIAEQNVEIDKLLDKYNYANITHLFMYTGINYDELGNVFFNDLRPSETRVSTAGYEVKNDKAYQALCIDKFVTMTGWFREKAPTMQIFLTWSSHSNNPIVNKAMDENINAFIKNMIDFANANDFDGIDIDYEFPQTDYDYATFDNFLVKLKASMDINMNNKTNSLLSCAFGTRDINYSKEAVAALDFVNCMTYDIADQDGQHASFWGGCVQGAKYLENVGFSKSQINIGIPFYGTQLDALMEQYLYSNLAGQTYYENTYTVTDYIGRETEAYFNSPSMVRDKTAYALLAGYGGVMTWHSTIDIDCNEEMSLWRAINQAVIDFGGKN